MFSIKDKIKFITAFIAFTSFVFIALFGLLTMPMHMDAEKGMIMSPCPYMQGGSSLCPMNLIDHIQAWQNTLRAVPNKTISLILVALLFATISSFFFKETLWLEEMYERQRIKRYKLRHLTFHKPLLFRYLFSQGILNPKSY